MTDPSRDNRRLGEEPVVTFEVYGCCDTEFAGNPEYAQRRLLEHIHTQHCTDPDYARSDREHLQRSRF